MCIIIDANVAGEFSPPTNCASLVLRRVSKGALRIVAEPKLKKELVACSFRSLYIQFFRAGLIFEYSQEEIDCEIRKVYEFELASNDHHIIALARLSGARVLFSRDERLHEDFKNRQILNRPRGRVYTDETHVRLLDEANCRCHL